MEELETLAALIHERNRVDESISRLIGRPATMGHIGEFIASKVFDIQLEVSAAHKAWDGRFTSGSLAGRTVDIKFYGKQEGLLAISQDEQPDYFLILTGRVAAAASSKGSTRPTTIEHVYLFEGRALAADVLQRGVKFGAAASIPKSQWEQAEIFPNAANPEMPVTKQQWTLLALFSAQAGV